MTDPQWGQQGQPGQPPVPEAPSSFPPPPGAAPGAAPPPAAQQQWGATQPGPPPGVGGPGVPAAKAAPLGASALLAIGALVLLVLGLSIPEDDVYGWEVGAWAVFAVACALAVFLVPLSGAALNLTPDRAWRVAAAAAGGLFVFWLLIVVPQITDNTSFLVTAATAAAAGAVWLAPGRPQPPPE
jgi:hypothetical protein